MMCPKCNGVAVQFMTGCFPISPYFCECGWVDDSIPLIVYKRQAILAESVHNPVMCLFPSQAYRNMYNNEFDSNSWEYNLL